MSVWKKTMMYLGLGPDEEYESAPPPVGMHPDPTMAPPGDFGAAPAPVVTRAAEATAIRPLGAVDVAPEPTLRPIKSPTSPTSGSTPIVPSGPSESRVSTVRPIPAGSMVSTKPRVLSPRSFNDAQEIGDIFRDDKPVIVNLQDGDRELSRRLIDFASGLCYGLDGQMEKVADRVYLLTPTDIEISPEDRIELREQGLHDA